MSSLGTVVVAVAVVAGVVWGTVAGGVTGGGGSCGPAFGVRRRRRRRRASCCVVRHGRRWSTTSWSCASPWRRVSARRGRRRRDLDVRVVGARRGEGRDRPEHEQHRERPADLHDPAAGARPLEARPHDASTSSTPSTSGASADKSARQRPVDLVERIGAHDCGSSAPRNVARAACRWYFTAPSLRPMASAISLTLRSST